MRTIAIEEHYTTRAVIQANAEAVRGDVLRLRPRVQAMSDKLLDLGEDRIHEMDAGGVDLQVLSLNSPGLQLLDAATAVPLARETNDLLAEAVARHPDRLAGFAALPTADPDASARELERCVRDLGFKGAMVNGMPMHRFMDDEFFLPILEAAEGLDVPLYLHPAQPPPAIMDCYFSGMEPAVGASLATSAWGWHVETGLHALRLIVSGVFDRLPRLRVVIGHMGEAIPFMLARAGVPLTPDVTGLRKPLADYVRENLWVTTSGFFTFPPLLNALLVLGADRIIFSVDYPFASNDAGRSFLDSMQLSDADREKIAHGNAERLLKL